jgi:hypothetical protein
VIDDLDVRDSPAWWLTRLVRKLHSRQPRLQLLHDYQTGNPPLPAGSENMRDAYRRFQRKARTNFAELIVEAPRERMTPVGVRTGSSGDRVDDVAQTIWDQNGLDTELPDTFEHMLGLGDGYMIVGGIDDALGVPLVTSEDPRQVVTIHDPARQRHVRAGLKLFHDHDEGRDLAYVYLPGTDGAKAEVHVAYREIRRRARNHRITFNSSSWTWDDDLTGELTHDRVPVVRFRNRRGIGQFEHHTDLLDRINHMVLSRMVIAAMQAYRQRALKGAPTHDENGEEIDYETIFSADPGAIWDLPAGVDIWESNQTDFSPILNATKADVEYLAAVTKLPIAQFMPTAMPQSAEGATLAKEGLIFVAEDRIKRADGAIRDVFELAFLTMGDTERANRSGIRVLWLPPERRSLAERADAASKVREDIPWETRLSSIYGYTPVEIAAMRTQRAQDALLAPSPSPTERDTDT